MNTENIPYINIHSHYKPRDKNELVTRNAYLRLTPEQVSALPYKVSAGLHPWHLLSMSLRECGDKLIELASLENVFAIGEIGIDRAIDIPISTQLAYFDTQLNIARALKKPVIIHAVKSYSDLVPFLKKTKVPFIFHQFSGNEQQAKELLKYNCLLSFGKNLFYEKAQQVLKQIPDAGFLLETDAAPRLTIEEVYEQAAKIKQLETDELKSVLFHTFAGLNT
jgi:TatD DNase family protein